MLLVIIFSLYSLLGSPVQDMTSQDGRGLLNEVRFSPSFAEDIPPMCSETRNSVRLWAQGILLMVVKILFGAGSQKVYDPLGGHRALGRCLLIKGSLFLCR